MDPEIRDGTLDDVHEVLQLWRRAETEPTHTDDMASLSKVVTHGSSTLLVAETGSRIIGSVIAGWDGWRGSLYRLAVDPTFRRRGLGRRLIEEAESRLTALGARRFQAIVVSTDGTAMEFWIATAWERQTERSRFVRSSGSPSWSVGQNVQ